MAVASAELLSLCEAGLDCAPGVLQNARETVAPVFSKVNNAAKQQYSKALENEKVACTQLLNTAGCYLASFLLFALMHQPNVKIDIIWLASADHHRQLPSIYYNNCRICQPMLGTY